MKENGITFNLTFPLTKTILFWFHIAASVYTFLLLSNKCCRGSDIEGIRKFEQFISFPF
jgi:hypothetical protein